MKLGVLNGRVRFPRGGDGKLGSQQGEHFSPAFCDLIAGMLSADPKRRLTLTDVRRRVKTISESAVAVSQRIFQTGTSV
jgi:hypothetical protein